MLRVAFIVPCSSGANSPSTINLRIKNKFQLQISNTTYLDVEALNFVQLHRYCKDSNFSTSKTSTQQAFTYSNLTKETPVKSQISV